MEAINDAEEALYIVAAAFSLGKSVITANKKMISQNLHALIKLQELSGQPVLCEAAVCPGLPVIGNLELFHDKDPFREMRGVISGAANFVLSRMFEDGMDFDTALRLAIGMNRATGGRCRSQWSEGCTKMADPFIACIWH